MRPVRTLLLTALAALLPAAARAAEGAKPLLDLPQVLTQIVGFVLLVWVLRATAWGPLVGLLEERRKKIADEFEEAERRKAEAEGLKGRYEQELRAIDVKARERIQVAVAEGQRVAAEIKQQAHAEAMARLGRAEEEIAREREKAKEILKEQVAQLSIRTAEKILRQRLDDAAQRRMVETFIDEASRLP